MVKEVQTLEKQWRTAVAKEDLPLVESLIQTILVQHPTSSLASEIRYQRGFFTMEDGLGTVTERLQKALTEFEAGLLGGEESEPWFSLNKTMVGTCLLQLEQTEKAKQHWKEILNLRPRRTTALGAYHLLIQAEDDEAQSKSLQNQQLSYTRALHREAQNTDEKNFFGFLLSEQLLQKAEFHEEGKEILESLMQQGSMALGKDLFQDVEASYQQWFEGKSNS